MMTLHEAVNATYVLDILREAVGDELYNTIMDEAIALTEDAHGVSYTEAISFAADKYCNEATATAIAEFLDETFFGSPLKSKLEKLKIIKDAKPKDYEGPAATKKFVDMYYDDIVKASRILEKEPEELFRNDIISLVGLTVSVAGGYALMLTAGSWAAVGAGVAIVVLASIFSMVYVILQYIRTHHDSDAADQLNKIRRALKKIDSRKLPVEQRRKLDDCLEAIDDAETAISARIKISNESADVMGSIWGVYTKTDIREV